MSYSQLAIDHFNAPRNAGRLNESLPRVGTALLGKPGGEVIRFQVRLTQEGTVGDVGFLAHGGAAAIACCSLATEQLKGRDLEAARGVTANSLVADLELSPTKLPTALLVQDAIRAALDNAIAKS